MLLHIIEEGLKINMAECSKILYEVLLSWIKKIYDPMKVVSVQDSTPAHGSKTVRTFLKRELLLFVPSTVSYSSSSDFNLCNYCIWGDVENVSNILPYNSACGLPENFRGVTIKE